MLRRIGAVDYAAIEMTRGKRGAPFGVGATETVLKDRPYGAAWDLGRATGRIAVIETILVASLRIVVMQYMLDAFRRTQATKS